MGKRILTAVIGVPILLGLLYLGGLPWMLFIAALMFIATFEMARIAKHININISLWAVYLAEIFMLIFIYLNIPHWASIGIAIGFIGIIGQGVFTYPKLRLEDMAMSFFTMIYVGWGMCHLIILEQMNVFLLVYLFLAIWGSDSGAYFTGRLCGKHKLAPALSPKKTKEGAIGGVLCAILLVVLFNVYLGENALLSYPVAILFGIVISIVGQIGDLAESMIKRFADVKDSGKILPGHGGILDRFDSIIMAAPFVYYLLIIISMINILSLGV